MPASATCRRNFRNPDLTVSSHTAETSHSNRKNRHIGEKTGEFLAKWRLFSELLHFWVGEFIKRRRSRVIWFMIWPHFSCRVLPVHSGGYFQSKPVRNLEHKLRVQETAQCFGHSPDVSGTPVDVISLHGTADYSRNYTYDVNMSFLSFTYTFRKTKTKLFQ